MRGLKALKRIRRVTEEKALRELASARRRYEAARAEEAEVRAQTEKAKEALRSLERERFGVRQSLAYRRYMNALRSRAGRCRRKTAAARRELEGKRKEYDRTRHEREAVDELIRKRTEREKKERSRRDEIAIGELAQSSWARRK